MVALLWGHIGPRPKSVGVVAGILVLPLSAMEGIHAAGKTFRLLMWIAILFFIVLLVILQFIFMHPN
jgi:hypothetical protein